MNPVELFLLFLKASFLSFGGLGSLTILHQDLVDRGVSEAVFGQALAVGRLSPGPNGLYLVSLGYQLTGLSGAAAATLALLEPPFTVVAIAISYAKVSHLWRTQSALLMVGFALTGLLGYTAWQIVAASAHEDWLGWAAGGVGFLAATRTKWHPLALIGGAALIGIAVYR